MQPAQVLVGADPELFMRHPDNGSFISAHGRIPGTKWEPHKVPFGAVQVDGTALEFNIDPAKSVDEFVHHIKAVRETIAGMVPGYNVVAEPVAVYDLDYFRFEIPSQARELGCMPDFNGWTHSLNDRPNDEAVGPMRTAAGHIHVGWTENQDVEGKEHFLYCCKVARQLDYYLGISSLVWDQDATRRALYGKAGAFRPKPYGMEYRVLSNRWLESDGLITWVYNTTQVAMADAFSGMWAEEKYGDLARQIIDNNVVDWRRKHPTLDLLLESIPGDESVIR